MSYSKQWDGRINEWNSYTGEVSILNWKGLQDENLYRCYSHNYLCDELARGVILIDSTHLYKQNNSYIIA